MRIPRENDPPQVDPSADDRPRKLNQQILSATSIIGGAAVIKIFFGLLRMKLVAIWLGPSGVGLIAIYTNIVTLGSTFAGSGLNMSGVRRIAAAQGDDATLSLVRAALLIGNCTLGLVGGLVLWLFREQVATLVLDDPAAAPQIGWLALGIFLSLLGNSFFALIQGMRRIRDLAKAQLLGGLLALLVTLPVLAVLGADGIVWFVLLAPAANLLVVWLYARRIPRAAPRRVAPAAFSSEIWGMVRVGMPFMLSGLLGAGTMLAIRSQVSRELGLDEAGLFHAAWAISSQYMGLVLGAMAADFFPRLSSAGDDRAAAREIVNRQVELALVLSAPMILVMTGLAPFILTLLYSSDFTAGANMLRWLSLGNVLEAPAWALGFMLLAKGRSGLFLLAEAVRSVSALAILWLLLPLAGADAAAMALMISRGVYLVGATLIVAAAYGFTWSREALASAAALVALCVIMMILAQDHPLACAAVGLLAGAAAGVFGLRSIAVKTGGEGRIGAAAARMLALVGWRLK